MKKIIFFLLASFIVLSCTQEYIEPIEFSDVSWYNDQFGKPMYNTSINGFVQFTDLSHGALSHSWELTEGTGSYFLEGRISPTDTVYTKYISSTLGLSTVNPTIHVLFTKPGLQSVRLYNTYKDKVTFLGRDTLEAKPLNGVWVIDTTFIVDVYDIIAPKYALYINDVEILPNKNPKEVKQIDIMAGSTIKLVDLTKQGRPTSRTWNISGGNPSISNDSVATIQMNRLGTFKGSLNCNRGGQYIPAGFAKIDLPFIFNVIKSDVPFVASKAIETPNEYIRLSVNGELNNFVNQASFFKVSVRNTGFNRTIAVSEATICKTDATIIELKLAEKIYNTDIINISYANGNITSKDERTMQEFNNLRVTMYIPPMILDPQIFGFEAGDGTGWWCGESDYFSFSKEQSYSGEYSLKLVAAPGVMIDISNSVTPGLVKLEQGKSYYYRYRLWIDPSTTATIFNTVVAGPWIMLGTNITNQPKSEWIEIRQEFTYTAGTKNDFFHIRIEPSDGNIAWGAGDAILYFDDITLYEKEIRK